ncbi:MULTISPECIES: tyrosine-type recombinase/integrase [Bacillus cereus group]|uniref:tyrosine-type recombinase/integrase n=1 Tax=Bacillus cereus group TaxID=86661 RepID=UPI0005A34F7E|nr:MULTISPECIES: tyrosine-type recombinase/integrase [Bacillus cereus group]AJH67880.1 phage integrase family protein [Bacillus thuringiensis]PGY97787.1 integrase [Bacillus cereus]QKH30196.1 tyrosine-type recombinase/integrase [Bacillus thuringiensis]QKQ41331.1 tyrosine-type recombinase/integrase [Bacillus thuringiensis]QQU29341.1 tyrosine-type recombinase/integrase [Bacillus cereus]
MSRTGKRGKAKLSRTSIEVTQIETYTFQELFNIYMFAKEAEGLVRKTLENKKGYFLVFHRYLEEHHEDVTPNTLDTNTIREFLYYLKNDHVKHKNNHCVKEKYKSVGVSVSYINTIMKHMRAFYNFLVEEEYVQLNPFTKIKSLKEVQDNIEALSVDQLKTLLKQPNQRTYAGFRDYVLMMLLADTGMRISEALNLQQEDIDFKTNVIELKGTNTKNRKTRYVPISQKTSKLLRELLVEIEEFDTLHIFATVYGNTIDPARFRQRLKMYGNNSGIKGVRVSPHTFRHTFAKYYLLNNGDVMTLQKILGHSSIEMVRKYINMTSKDIVVQHNKYSPVNNL